MFIYNYTRAQYMIRARYAGAILAACISNIYYIHTELYVLFSCRL